MIDQKYVKNKFFPDVTTKEQAKDTGMALILILLLISYISSNTNFVLVSVILLIVNMIFPDIYRPLVKIWFGFSNILGTFVSRLLLVLIFFVFVTPIGLFRKMLGVDPLQLKEWKRSTRTVFESRDHLFQPEEIERPY